MKNRLFLLSQEVDGLIRYENTFQSTPDLMKTFRLYAAVEMNQKIGRDAYISPGGYEMIIGGKLYNFDFCESEIYIDTDNPRILHIMQKNPDFQEFDGLDKMGENLLKYGVLAISEFFIYLGEDEETNLTPVRLLDARFTFPYLNERTVTVSAEVCSNAKLAS